MENPRLSRVESSILTIDWGLLLRQRINLGSKSSLRYIYVHPRSHNMIDRLCTRFTSCILRSNVLFSTLQSSRFPVRQSLSQVAALWTSFGRDLFIKYQQIPVAIGHRLQDPLSDNTKSRVVFQLNRITHFQCIFLSDYAVFSTQVTLQRSRSSRFETVNGSRCTSCSGVRRG
jgi:hypothetical protein